MAPDDRPYQLFLFSAPRFVVLGNGVDLSEKILKALALVVLNGSCINRDALIEGLWPEAPLASGRHQLRNVLTGLRRAGLTLERQGAAVILRESVWCDVEEFILAASRAVSGIDGRSESYRLALHAQSLWTGAPLEPWRYEQWAIPVRSRVFRLQQRLWDLSESVAFGPAWPPTDGAVN